MIGKVTELFPAGTLIDVGTAAAAGALLTSATVAPAEPAYPFKETVPVALEPPTTADGLQETNVASGGVTVITALAKPPDWFATLTVTAVGAFTGELFTTNVPVVFSAAIVDVAGTVKATGTLDVRVSVSGTVPAGPPSVTVHTASAPPITLVGANTADLTWYGNRFTMVVAE